MTPQTPLVKGPEARLWELPMCFEFDDWMYEHVEDGILTVAMHPQVIGRGHRVAMLEHFIEHGLAAGNVRFARMCDVAQQLESVGQ